MIYGVSVTGEKVFRIWICRIAMRYILPVDVFGVWKRISGALPGYGT